MPRVFESNFCWKARVQTQAYLRGNTQMSNSTRKKCGKDTWHPKCQTVNQWGKRFPDMVVSKSKQSQILPTSMSTALVLPSYSSLMNHLTGNINILDWPKVFSGFSITSSGKTQTNVLANPIHHGSLISISATERQYATNTSTKAPHKNKPISGQIPDPDNLCMV